MFDEPGPSTIIEVESGNPQSIRELVVVYLRAVERFRLQYTLASAPERQLEAESRGYAALAEALGWADSIDNYLREGPKESSGTRATRSGRRRCQPMRKNSCSDFSEYAIWSTIVGGRRWRLV